MAFKAEIKCLNCEGQYIKPDHTCPIGLCDGANDSHFDFCQMCRKLMNKGFHRQLPGKWIPKVERKLRTEDDCA